MLDPYRNTNEDQEIMRQEIHIFRSDPDSGIARLARLDSQRPPTSPVLAVEVNGQLRAALPLDGSPAIADPFHPTTELVTLLRLRAAQLFEPTHGRAPRPLAGLGRWMRRAWRAASCRETTTSSRSAAARGKYGISVSQPGR
jgi:hypothetical protein